VDNIDLWVGALAEDHVPGTSTGPLIRAGLIDQFTRLRDGDSFFYRNPNMAPPFSASDLSTLENDRTLADLIRLDSGADVIQDNIFFFRVRISGTVFNDLDRDGRQDAGEGGLSGRTLTLINVNDPANPVVVATTTTNSGGNYRFDVFDGLSTGNFQVVETVPAGWRATTANPRTVNIPRGETFLDVDFGNARTTSTVSGAAAPSTDPTAPTAPSTGTGGVSRPQSPPLLPPDQASAGPDITDGPTPGPSAAPPALRMPEGPAGTTPTTAFAPPTTATPLSPTAPEDPFLSGLSLT